MSSLSRRPRPRALRPLPEALEGRQLLSKTITGTDPSGDRWVLKLIGPGDLRVTTQASSNGSAVPPNSPALINEITVAGASPHATRLVGRVTKTPTSAGRVFFQRLTEIGGPNISGTSGNGLLAVDMPNFWLGFTDPNAPLTRATEPAINIPDGVISLRFGGVDTTAFFGSNAANSPATNNQSDQYAVNLGIPVDTGTSIIIDRSISNAQAAATTTGTTATPTQDSVLFNVSGRINLFQANAVDGNAAFPATGFQGGGGTLVVSSPSNAAGIVGAIGTVRVLGNATNFSTATSTRVGNFHVGGETNTVSLLSPSTVRNVSFGKGMDTVEVRAHDIRNLSANRGALNSTVITDREIFHARFGGDVVNTNLYAGYQQNLAQVFANQTAPTTFPTAETGGAIDVAIAGSVINSVFAASVEPLVVGATPNFGTAQDLFFPRGRITAKVEGRVDNAAATPDQPTKAFYARLVRRNNGPVLPPTVPEQPLPIPRLRTKALGLHHNGTASAAKGAGLSFRRLTAAAAHPATVTHTVTTAHAHVAAKK